jgi:3'-5' exoribonuclease
MKRQFIGSFKAGESIDDIFVLTEKAVAKKRDGNNYLTIIVSDKTGQIKGVVWDNVDEILATNDSGSFVRIKGSVSQYREKLQLVVKEMIPCPVASVEPDDFLPATNLDVDDLFERLTKICSTIKNQHIKSLIEAFFNDETFVRDFKRCPAGKKMHHAYLGGLLVHTLSMVMLADKIAQHYEGINRDLLITGTFFHDIGKIRELTYRYTIDYSDEGRLLSHIVIGVQMIDEKLADIPDFPEDLEVLLKHMIVSHHGSYEFGSPELPKTLEAILLHYIDEIDSKVNGIRDFIASENSGESWTSYHRLLGRHFFIGNK